MDLKALKDEEIVQLYSDAIKELKERNIIRTKNVIGDLGEYLAIKTYCNTPGLPNLAYAPVGTQHIDAISRAGERYSIKSTTNTTTGVFTGLNKKGSQAIDRQVFEYVIICKFDDDCKLEAIYEINWETFMKYKRWHTTMGAWNLGITKDLIADSKVIYKRD